jgi:DNA topoisomerase-1
VYVSDEDPGIRRERRGRRFRYVGDGGGRVSARERKRIDALAIPPAWKDVWIAAQRRGHIQATGRDARGRKQYRYHDAWREARDADKFEHVLEFGERLPRIREAIARDLRLEGLPREKVLAAVVRLLERTRARVGNEEYARDNQSFGLTTLRDRHAQVGGEQVRLRFVGKGGKEHRIQFSDRRLAKILRQCQELPGQRLFAYVDDDGPHAIGSADVNDYIREAAGGEFTAKDFRAWSGSVLALASLVAVERPETEAEINRCVVAAIDEVAHELRNTRTVCRKFYVHPRVVEAFERGALASLFPRGVSGRQRGGLHAEERALLRLLRRKRGFGAWKPRARKRAPARRASSRRDRPSSAASRRSP